ncbi:MAG: TRAP transporter substrate-binding protein DctP [Desulfovibrionaceae bacterium]
MHCKFFIYIVLSAFLSFPLSEAIAAKPARLIYCSVGFNPVAQAGSAQVLAVLEFKKSLERLSSGVFRVRIAWDNGLAPNYATAQRSLLGDKIHFTQFSSSSLAAFTSAILPLSTLFLFKYPDMTLPQAALDGPVGARIRDRTIRETGLRILAFWELGYRHLTSSTKQLNTLESIKGEKWRIQPNPVYEDAFRRLGMLPVSLSWQQLYEVLRVKGVSGSDNTLAGIEAGHLYEVQKNLLLTGHGFEFLCIMTSERFYKSLSETERRQWDKAIVEATQVYRKNFAHNSVTQEQKLRKRMHVWEMTAEQRKTFEELVAPSREIAAQRSGQKYYTEIMDAIKALRPPAPK